MAVDVSVARLLTGRIVQVLRLDADIATMLFEDRPPVSPFDDRVYSATAELPEEAVREVLPRILVAVVESAMDTEQDEASSSRPMADCAVFIHAFSEADDEDLGQRLAARARTVLTSTWLTDARIIVSKLTWVGSRHARESSFRDAHRFTIELRTNAGVL